MFEIKFEIYRKLFGEGKQRDEACTHLQKKFSNVCKVLNPAWELESKPSHCKGSLYPAVGGTQAAWR